MMRTAEIDEKITAYFMLAPNLRQKRGLAEEVEAVVNFAGEAYMRGIVRQFGTGPEAMSVVRGDFYPLVHNWIFSKLLSNAILVCEEKNNPPDQRKNGLLEMRLYYALTKEAEAPAEVRYLEFQSADLHASLGRLYMWRTDGKGMG